MDIQELRILLDRYYAGESTLQEEQQLRNYFSSAEVAEELKPYQALFVYMAEGGLVAGEEVATKALTPNALKRVKTKHKKMLYMGIGIAASLALMVSIVRLVDPKAQHVEQTCQGSFVMVDGKCTDDPREINRQASQAIEAILSSDSKAMENLEQQLRLMQ